MRALASISLLSASLGLAPVMPQLAAAENAPANVSPRRTGTVTGRVQNVVTGEYLNNARVSVRGTEVLEFTDQSGIFRLKNVPVGTVTLEVAYTGLDSQAIPVTVSDGGSVVANVELTSAARYGSGNEVLKLDSFVVSSAREMDAKALAINEQRYAANVKNVLAADAHGDVTEGNIAEFMKFMPGVVINYGDASANSVSVRGLGSNLTGVSVDGAPMAHAHLSGNDRTFQFKQVDINSVSRVELTKVPTPSTPADSMGGSVNLISKSAFDRKTAEFRWRSFFSINSEDFTFRQTPFPYEDNTYKAMPGFDVSYTKPFNEKFGIVFSAMSNIQYNVQDYAQTTWNGTTTAVGASPGNPYLQSVNVIDAPKYYTRQSANLQADWRVTPNSVLSFSIKGYYYKDDNGNYNWTANVGTVATPTPATGTPMTFGRDFTEGATGRGAVTMGGGHGHIRGTLLSENLRYRFDNGTWRISSSLSHSESTTSENLPEHGNFSSLVVSLKQPARVSFRGIQGNRPDVIKVYDNNNREIDIHDINNYQITEAVMGARDVRDIIKNADLNVRRAFSSFSVPSALQVGGAHKIQTRSRINPTFRYTYNGPGGDLSASAFAATVYNTPAPFGYGRIPWSSPKYAFSEWMKNPGLFTPTPAQVVANTTSDINASEYIEETVSALYLQPEVRLFRNRLHIMAGVRYEKTTDEGLGPVFDPAAVWVRNSDGTFARTANGSRIRKAEAGAVGSIEELNLTRQKRAYRAERSYDGYYPSLHFTYNVTDNLLVRLAYAETYGRPNFSEVIPNTTITERDVLPDDPNQTPGSISVRNTGLSPWSAKNYDLSLEYYSSRGGLFSAGVFQKDIKDFFGNVSRFATAADVEGLGLDPSYVGWILNTKFNAGDARVSGMEFNIQHSLGFLGEWGNHVQAFANGTRLRLEGNQGANFSGYVPKAANWGFTVTFKPITLMAQWNHRGETGRTAALGPGVSTYEKARTTLDLNLDYQFTRRLSFFANARNATNVYHSTLVYGSETPDYAKQRNVRNYGVQFGIGLKGVF